ncbi:hypothetical protein llap_751 [Limosa lapponica baueri]|uniref:Uncharacterized protein n=1 Tax=Limosa lapponica baueri TaxID=1758121 RepID=A0A2I0US62_LIMLA|nr:hypothetical protein llap_751 [Limosa lapponica baueri]
MITEKWVESSCVTGMRRQPVAEKRGEERKDQQDGQFETVQKDKNQVSVLKLGDEDMRVGRLPLWLVLGLLGQLGRLKPVVQALRLSPLVRLLGQLAFAPPLLPPSPEVSPAALLYKPAVMLIALASEKISGSLSTFIVSFGEKSFRFDDGNAQTGRLARKAGHSSGNPATVTLGTAFSGTWAYKDPMRK